MSTTNSQIVQIENLPHLPHSLNGTPPLDASTMPFSLSLLTASRGNASKKLKADLNGLPVDDEQHRLGISAGKIAHIQLAGLRGLRDLLQQITQKQALVHGIVTGSAPGHHWQLVLADKYTKKAGTIARSLDCFSYPDGPRLLMLDIDVYPGISTPATPAALMEQLTGIWPVFAEVGWLATISTRSAIKAKNTDDWLTPPRGFHVYMLCAGDIDAFREKAKHALWLAGTGYCKLSKPHRHTGVPAVLERCLIDLSVFSPERLDYVSGAILDKSAPFYRDAPPPVLHPGRVLNLDALPAVTETDRQQVVALVQAERLRIRPEQEATVRQHITRTMPAMDEAATTALITERLQQAERPRLPGALPLYFKIGGVVTVETVTAAYDRRRLADPWEPDYRDGDDAIFHWNGGRWLINSWAHGICKTYYPAQQKEHEQDTNTAGQEEEQGEADPWAKVLLLSKSGIPEEDVSNISLLLEEHEDWHNRLWFDVVRQRPMVDNDPLSDAAIIALCRWLGKTFKMRVRHPRLVESCAYAVCVKDQRDLLRQWVEALPVWDNEPRLTEWLHDVAEAPKDAYGMDVSRLLPVSLVARALDPGCQYRNVIILEGDEDTGKSKLVRTLASPEWFVELSMSLDSKEAHMMLQGIWLAELAELDSLSKTGETRLKSFVTMRDDAWIPKFSNFRTSTPRRTVFVGTSNDKQTGYLNSLTGNTRFLPIATGCINIADLEAIRLQLFAEALVYYHEHPKDWWQLSSDAACTAKDQREQRRVVNVYENDLGEWLDTKRFDGEYFADNKAVVFEPDKTSWAEIARHFLQIGTPEGWRDISLQKQIASALRALGWAITIGKDDTRKSQRYWRKQETSTPE